MSANKKIVVNPQRHQTSSNNIQQSSDNLLTLDSDKVRIMDLKKKISDILKDDPDAVKKALMYFEQMISSNKFKK